MAAPRGVSPLPRRAASHPCPESDFEFAALKAEITQLRRQASAPPSLEVAVWRELALREKCCLTALPEDVLQHIVNFIPLAHHIARKATTCKAISVAVRNAIKARKFSTEVVTLAGHTDAVRSVAVAPKDEGCFSQVVARNRRSALSTQRDDLLARDQALHSTVRELTEQVQSLQIQLRDLKQDHDNTKRGLRDVGRALGHQSESEPSSRFMLDAISALKSRTNTGGNGDLKKDLLRLMHPDKNTSKNRDELFESLGAATALINDRM